MMIEITFTFQNDSKSQKVTSFTYHFTKTDNLKESVERAKKYFTKFTKENGWTRKTKLVKIAPPKNENTPPPVRTVTPDPPRSRSTAKRKPSTRRSSPKRKTSKNSDKV